MEKKSYVKPILNSEAFVPQSYVAACAQYQIRLMCKEINVMHAGSTEYGGTGGCTTTITEFGATEEHGGIYNNDLTINGILLDSYTDIREYFKNIKDNNQAIEGITWSTDGRNKEGKSDGITYDHVGKLTFDRIADPGNFS